MQSKYCIPASRDAHKNLHSPLAGIRSRIDSSACGNAIKILHPRKRRFCIYFGSWSPRAEMHIKIFIPLSREYDLELTIPLAGMQSKYCIPASGASVTISRRCTQKFTFPPRGNTIQNRQFRLRECNQNFTSPQAEIVYLFRFMVPASGDAHKKFSFPPRGNTIQNRQFRLRECNQNFTSPQAEIL